LHDRTSLATVWVWFCFMGGFQVELSQEIKGWARSVVPF